MQTRVCPECSKSFTPGGWGSDADHKKRCYLCHCNWIEGSQLRALPTPSSKPPAPSHVQQHSAPCLISQPFPVPPSAARHLDAFPSTGIFSISQFPASSNVFNSSARGGSPTMNPGIPYLDVENASGDAIITFGNKHRGRTFRYVYETDKNYVEWVKRQDATGPLASFKNYISSCKAAAPTSADLVAKPTSHAVVAATPTLTSAFANKNKQIEARPPATSESTTRTAPVPPMSTITAGSPPTSANSQNMTMALYPWRHKIPTPITNAAMSIASESHHLYGPSISSAMNPMSRSARTASSNRLEPGFLTSHFPTIATQPVTVTASKPHHPGEAWRSSAMNSSFLEVDEQKQGLASQSEKKRGLDVQGQRETAAKQRKLVQENKKTEMAEDYRDFLKAKFAEYKAGYPNLKRFDQLSTGEDPFENIIKKEKTGWMSDPHHRNYEDYCRSIDWDPKKIIEWGMTFDEKYLPKLSLANIKLISAQKAAIAEMLRQSCHEVKPHMK
eukprot:gnl/MRDRNA2_/MRDRNA2_205156_c0_seq1.p1 gnl/MRDRNA2_/MRDRNA2_205156_c0~~gnl/MRDRNA2_/MRDRNA2_205156_c0_seq1.p1  ORF type:complete len:501 (+),score=67.52 gnl/MRDRNA2_/MRDRNA2_205156_c0_seq1:37-1539(+)